MLREADTTIPLEVYARVEVGEGILGKTASRGRIQCLSGEGFDEAAIPAEMGGGCGRNVDDAICVPLTDGDKTIGALALVNRRAVDHRDDQADEQLAVLLAGQLARAVVRLGQRQDAQRHDHDDRSDAQRCSA